MKNYIGLSLLDSIPGMEGLSPEPVLSETIPDEDNLANPSNVPNEGPLEFKKDKAAYATNPPLTISFRYVDGVPTYIVDLFGPVQNYYDYVKLLGLLTMATEDMAFDINIASPGGSIQIGATIGSAILKCKAKVTCVAVGPIYSIAMFIWSCGHFQRIKSGASFLIHMSSHGAYGLSTTIQSEAENLIIYVKDYLLGISLSKGHLLQEEFDTICTKSIDIVIGTQVMRDRLKSNVLGYIPEDNKEIM